MDAKEAIARFFCEKARYTTGQSFGVELIAGPGKGAGLRGCVGWDGARWHIQIDRNLSNWEFWRSLWHEAAHPYYGDVDKATSGRSDTDRALIAGVKTWATQARLDSYTEYRDADKETRCDKFADMMARAWLDDLNNHLATIPIDRAAGLKAINDRHGLNARAARRETKVVHFRSATTKAAAVLPAEYREWLERVFPDGWPPWIEATLKRHARYVKWLADLREQGLLPEMA